MALLFTLSMPNNNAWNGKWSGEGRFYGVVRNLGQSKKAKERQREILEKGYFHYNFGDGWAASIDVTEVTGSDITKARRRSQGFCGYEWMIDCIIHHLKIHPDLKGGGRL